MVLPHEGLVPVVQPNLGFQDEQEDIVNQLNTLSWKNRKSLNKYKRVSYFEEIAKKIHQLWGYKGFPSIEVREW